MNEETLIEKYNTAFNEILNRIFKKIEQGKYSEIDQALLFNIDKILKKLENDTLEYSEKVIPKMYKKNREEVMKVLAVMLGKEVVTGFVTIDERSVKEIQTLFSDSMLDGLSQTKKNINKLVKRAVEINKLQQAHPEKLAEKMANELKSNGIMTFEDKLGRKYNLVDYSEMAIRTAGTRAVNKSTINASLELENDLVKMSSHSSSCPICAVYEGRVYSISGNDKRYPALSSINKGSMVSYSTIHPFCRHRFTVYVEEFDDNSKQTRIDSNKPFIDTRSDYQRELYSKKQKQNVIKQRLMRNKEVIKAYEATGISKLTEEQKSEYNRLKLQNNLLRKENKKIETWKQDKK